MRARVIHIALSALLISTCVSIARESAPGEAGGGFQRRAGGEGRPGMRKPGGGGPGGERHGGDMLSKLVANPEMAARLGLDKEQVNTLKEEVFANRTRMIELKAQLEKSALVQARLMSSEELDEDALMSAIEETGRIRTELAKMKIKSLLTMRRTLKPEQLNKVRNAMRERMRERAQAEGREGFQRRREGREGGEGGWRARREGREEGPAPEQRR